MPRNGYWSGLVVGCIVLAVANVLLPLLTSITVATYVGYQSAKENGARGQSFNILIGLCFVVFAYSLFTRFPSPAVEMVATLSWMLLITKIIVSIPGKGVFSSIISPDKQLLAAAAQGKSIIAFAGALVNGPVLLGVAAAALAIIPLVILDLLVNLIFNGGENIFLLLGIPSLALGTMIWDTVDKVIGAVLGIGKSDSRRTPEPVGPSPEAMEMAEQLYAETDAELPAATESEWSFQDVASLTEAELSGVTRASFEAEAHDEELPTVVEFESGTDGSEVTLLSNADTGLDLAVLSVRLDTFDEGCEQELMDIVRTRVATTNVEPDLVILSVPIDIPWDTKLRWLAVYGVMVYDNELLRRQFLLHDPRRFLDTPLHAVPSR